MVMVTPPGADSPIAVSATSAPATPRDTSARASTPVAVRSVPQALATPIGDGHLALMTAPNSAIRRGAELDVQLTNGPVVTAVVDNTAGGLVIVRIKSSTGGHAIAATPPDANDIVTVLAEPPVTIAFSALTTLDAEEGTPVLDDDGDLIGLCSQRHGAGDDQPITLIDVTGDPSLDEQRAVATTTAP
jgi:hypothetical protein